jgi:hypothetical protein
VPGMVGAPIEDQQVATATPELRMSVGSDPDGDVLSYEFEIYSDPALANLVISAVDVPSAEPVVWTVSAALPEDGHYYWHGRAFDGFEHSTYTEVASFYVNAANQAPNTFNLMLPVNGGSTPDIYPRLTWHQTTDADPGDSLKYALWTSDDPSFAAYTETADIPDTFRTLTYPLTVGDTYFWKVKAIDRALAATWSSGTYNFTVSTSSCCVARRGNASDVSYLIAFLFGTPSGPAPTCWDEGNINGDTGDKVNVSDVTYLINYLFGVPQGPQPPLCP